MAIHFIHIIQSIEINVGGQTLQKYSGDYLTAMIERDFTEMAKQKKVTFFHGKVKKGKKA